MVSTLSAADWKKQLKTHPDAAETAPLTKALEEYGKVEGKDDHDRVVDALEEVIARAEAAKKKNAKLKKLVDHLDDLLGDAKKEKVKAAKEAKAGEEDEDEDDEGEAGAALRKSLEAVRKVGADRARPFVLALGAVAGLVIAKRPPLSRDHRNVAKAMRTGKGKLLFGRCYGDKGKFVFEFEDKPAGGLTKVIKKAAKVHAELEIRLMVRGPGVEIDDENDIEELADFGVEEEEVPPPPPVPGADPAERVKARARVVRALLDQLRGSDPALATALTARLAEALGHSKAGQHDRAFALLRAIAQDAEAAMKDVPSAGDAGPSQEDWSRRFAEAQPDFKKALILKPANVAEIHKRIAQATSLAKPGGDLRLALEVLGEAVALAREAIAGSEGGASAPGPEAAQFREELRRAEEDLARLARSNPDRARLLLPVIALARQRNHEGGPKKALAVLTELRPKLAAALDTFQTAPSRTVETWQAARDKVNDGINQLHGRLMKTGEADHRKVAELGLNGLTKRLQVGLQAALMDFDSAAGDARAKAGARVKKLVDSYRTFLTTDRVVELVDDNPFGVAVDIRGTLGQALDTIDRALIA